MSGKMGWIVKAVLVAGAWGAGVLAPPVSASEASTSAKPTGQLAEIVNLKRGEVKRLYVMGITRVSVDNPSIADISGVSSNAVDVTGLSVGNTPMSIWTSDGRRRAYSVYVSQ